MRLHLLILEALLEKEGALLCELEIVKFDLVEEIMEHVRELLSQALQVVDLEVLRVPPRHLFVVLPLLEVVKQRMQCVHTTAIIVTSLVALVRRRRVVRVESPDVPVSARIEDLHQLCVEVDQLTVDLLVFPARIVPRKLTHVHATQLMELHVKRDELVHMHYHFLVILLFLGCVNPLFFLVNWRGYRGHHLFIIEVQVFILFFFLVEPQLVAGVVTTTHPGSLSYPGSLDARGGLFEGTWTVLYKVMHYAAAALVRRLLPLLDIHRALQVTEGL